MAQQPDSTAPWKIYYTGQVGSSEIKDYIWSYMQKETESRCRLLRAAADQTLVTQVEGAKGTDSRAHMWETLSTLHETERELRARCVCQEIHNFLILLVFLYVSNFDSNFENMDWQRKDSYQEKATFYVPLGCVMVGMCLWVGSFSCLFTDTKEGNLADAWHCSPWIQTVKREPALLSPLNQDLQAILHPLLSLWLVCWG